jgi:hypothetical protein
MYQFTLHYPKKTIFETPFHEKKLGAKLKKIYSVAAKDLKAFSQHFSTLDLHPYQSCQIFLGT